MKESSLVAFTLMAQTAAGAYCVLAGAQWAFGAVYLNRVTLPLVCALVALAMLVSLLHLGTPQKAYRAVLNLRSSWLSREIVAVSLFCACVGIQAGYSFQWDPAGLPPVVLAITGGVALASVYCMSRVYRLRTMPAWDSGATLLSFLAASFANGSAVVLVLLSAQGALAAGAGGAGASVTLAIPVLLVACLALEVALLFWRTRLEPRPDRFGEIQTHHPAVPHLRLLLGVMPACGLALVVLALAVPGLAGTPGRTAWLALASIVIVTAEILNRASFYRLSLGGRRGDQRV